MFNPLNVAFVSRAQVLKSVFFLAPLSLFFATILAANMFYRIQRFILHYHVLGGIFIRNIFSTVRKHSAPTA